MEFNVKKKTEIIIACNFRTISELLKFLKFFKDRKLFLKIGSQFLCREGFLCIRILNQMGHKVFIDLKLYDTPHTVRDTLEALTKYEIKFLTVHLSGGLKMLKIAKNATKNSELKLLGVSVLTSYSKADWSETFPNGSLTKDAQNLILLAKKAGLTGVVCSVDEIKFAAKHNLLTVVPGIRLWKKDKDDQVRVSNPSRAARMGADYLVIGRAITKAKNPCDEYNRILRRIWRLS